MANANQIKALIKSHSEGDNEWFYSVALQLAADSARQGHTNLARELKKIIDDAKINDNKNKNKENLVNINSPRGDLAGLLSISYPKTKLKDMVLSNEIKQRLDRILLEHRNSYKIESFGLKPRHKILLVGKPGTGKTMSSHAISGELNLPLFTILLDGLITKFMGETSAKLRIIFDTISKTRGVYLFDEFDSIAGKRDLGNDVGEARRILNSFLQFIEQDESNSLIVAATNHPELLDKAIFRRFDDIIEYDLPDNYLIKNLFESRLSIFDIKNIEWNKIFDYSKTLSYAEIVKVCEDVAKETILNDQNKITTEKIIENIETRKSTIK